MVNARIRIPLQNLRVERKRIAAETEAVETCIPDPPHISDHDLERYHLGMVKEPELSELEQHLL